MTSIEDRIEKALAMQSGADLIMKSRGFEAASRDEQEKIRKLVKLIYARVLARKNTGHDNDAKTVTVAELLAELTDPNVKDVDHDLIKNLNYIATHDSAGRPVNNDNLPVIKILPGHFRGKDKKDENDEEVVVLRNLSQYLPKKN